MKSALDEVSVIVDEARQCELALKIDHASVTVDELFDFVIRADCDNALAS